MASPTKNPAPREGAGQVLNACLAACGSEPTKIAPDLQQIRAAWITRRCAVSPDMAIFLATVILGEARL